MNNSVIEFNWVGSQENFVDKIDISNFSYVSLGRFGGNSKAGQYKNEDACLIWLDPFKTWEFTVIMDAHNTALSAELVLQQLERGKKDIQALIILPIDQAFREIESTLLSLFQEEQFLEDCRKVQGETACLIVLRKDKYIWWFSVGDCISMIFHEELAKLGQYEINQRQFYEWIGQVNTFNQAIPCYSSGIRELRKSVNRIFLTTDGLIECPNEPFSSGKKISSIMNFKEIDAGLTMLLQTVKDNHVRDSTTVICWDVNITQEVTEPSDA
ncbi:protein phosphatase 2C domain-containing protein [Ureibacillus chungkukjangi]|nr:protein phosphatase 2C domain-containing protein [Ureibacillus chungkukjangi]